MTRLAHRLHTDIVAQIAITALAFLFVLPLIVAVRVSLMGQGWKNYVAALTEPHLSRFFLNSVIVTATTIVLVYVITLFAAYAFSKLPLRGKTILFNLILAGLMLPSVVLVVPLFLSFRSLQLFNSYWALILPYTALALPFTLLLMKQFFDDLPNELLDAAKIDGCNSFTTLLRVIWPLSKAISVVVIIWTFLSAWNEYFLALVFMQSDNMKMITQAPQYFVGVYGEDVGKVFASLIVISLPLIITYILLQRYFEDGLTSGALK